METFGPVDRDLGRTVIPRPRKLKGKEAKAPKETKDGEQACDAIRRSSSFVAPTTGSAYSLTLTTYLTDAADLHYAAVLAGQPPLEAAAIKSAAQQCAEKLQSDGDTADTRDEPPSFTVVDANTVAVHRAQKVERRLEGLRANTSYDVYFVAEVPNSNGVYGAVLSVTGTTTYPAPPALVSTLAAAVNASASAAIVNVTLTAPGIVHMAFVPTISDACDTFTVGDLITRNHRGMSAVFATEKRYRWDSLMSSTVVEDLSPATEYDMLLVTEALGNGKVYSALHKRKRFTKSHATAPHIASLACAPSDGSSSSIEISFRLQFSPDELEHVTVETLEWYQYQVHYDVVKEQTSSTNGSGHDSTRSTFPLDRFTSIDDLLNAGNGAQQKRAIDGLAAGSAHEISLVAETVKSGGVVGRQGQIGSCYTHATPPRILHADVRPVNETVHALRVEVELEGKGNVHYVLAPQAAMASVRHTFRQAQTVETLTQMMEDDRSTLDVRAGVVEVSDLVVNATTVTKSFIIDELIDNTVYGLVVIPETIDSFGVFGQPFDSILEATTNENASDVTIVSAVPAWGSLSSIELHVGMSKPSDILSVCIRMISGEETCEEVSPSELAPTEQFQQMSSFAYTAGNLIDDAEYEVSAFAESRHRNGVRSGRAQTMALKTHRQAPQIVSIRGRAVDARVDAVSIQIGVSEPGMVHYVIEREEVTAHPGDGKLLKGNTHSLAAASIVGLANDPRDEEYVKNAERERSPHSRHRSQDKMHQSHRSSPSGAARFIKRGQAFVSSRSLGLLVEGLAANMTYVIHAVTETSSADFSAQLYSSGVYGEPMRTTVVTHDVAPTIVKATANAVSNRTDSIFVTLNVSRPGIVHYQLTDTDFADPAVIRDRQEGRAADAHVMRGSFIIEASDIVMELINGTNDSQPMDPLVFANNFTVYGLHEDTTYHLSLTSETTESAGVLGDFPAPILVTTHAPSPQFLPHTLQIEPVAGMSTALSIQFQLDQIGEVHYAIFFRGLVRDRTTNAAEAEEQRRIEREEAEAEAEARDAGNTTSDDTEESSDEKRKENREEKRKEKREDKRKDRREDKRKDQRKDTRKDKRKKRNPRWPPPSSQFDLAVLTPRALKDAAFEELGEGVWENGTISVSRDDVFKLKVTEKKLEKLPPNALFDVCVVPETAASDGVFAPLFCQRVATHADYTNQSVTFDEVHVSPVGGSSEGVHIELQISKLLGMEEETTRELMGRQRLERLTGRVPYFVLIDGEEGRADFSHNAIAPHSHRHDRSVSAFTAAVPGRGNVVATGTLSNITHENDTFIVVEQIVGNLRENQCYFFFFAYETAGSQGVFTEVNPHRHRPNETSSRHSESKQAIEVTTHEKAPRLKSFLAQPTYGNTSWITVEVEISCAVCEESVLHLLVVDNGCSVPSTRVLLDAAGGPTTAESTPDRVARSENCDVPLIYKRVEVNMTERDDGRRQHHHHHSRHHHHGNSNSRLVTVDVQGDAVLAPNTTYQVLLAAETQNSGGVISDAFEVTRVTTSPKAPHFTRLEVLPRSGSTTELLMLVGLEYPGEVHYMLGKSGNPELNVTSPYNVSAKSLPDQRDSKFHSYGREVVRSRRTIKVEQGGQTHVEIVDYLVAGTSYDVYVVAETAHNNGVYGEVVPFSKVATFATPPRLLAHTAYPTPGMTDSLSVGFRVEEGIPSIVHVSVITTKPWAAAAHAADGSDTFGNRLAFDDRLIARVSVPIDKDHHGAADGWNEVNMSVPLAGTNYTVFLVTETKDSDGVFGTVATHRGVQSHREPPVPLNVSVRPTDARVDALTVDVTLNHGDGAHIHYAVLRHRQRFTRSAITKLGRADVNGSASASFLIDGLLGRTAYDIYLRMETFESGGVLGEWAPFPITASTHGLPAELLESVECETAPSCEAIGRQPCSHVAHVCGECLDGFDGVAGSSNTACRQLEPEETGPTLKISGVRINPHHRRHQHMDSMEEQADERTLIDTNEEASPEKTHEEYEAEACPLHAARSGSGECECETGFHLDRAKASCVPLYENPLLSKTMAVDYASRAL